MGKIKSVISTIILTFAIFTIFVNPSVVYGDSNIIKNNTLNSKSTIDSLVSYQVYMQGKGWGNYVSSDMAGTVGESIPILGIRIKLNDSIANSGEHIQYRVHVSNIGWMDWVKDGTIAGLPDKNLPIEAIQMKIVDDKGDVSKNYTVSYISHIKNIGWESCGHSSGEVSGTTGKSLPIEAISIGVYEIKEFSPVIKTCSQKQGWSNWENCSSGSQGKSNALTGIRIQLPTDLPEKSNIHIVYRVHVSNVGWMDWVKDGAIAGLPDKNLPIEAIQIKLVDDKGNISSKYTVSYQSHISNIGWESCCHNSGEVSGTTGKSLPIECIMINICKK